MNEFDSKYDILDVTTPPNTWLTAHYKKSFAYYTIRERLPVILTQIVDHLSRDKEQIAIEYGGKELSMQELAHEQIKEIQGGISKLKYELQTDKPLMVFEDNVPDKEKWNEFLGQLDPSLSASYFTGTWLAVECYMYRRLKSIFAQSSLLANFDYFRKQKQNALNISYETMTLVLEHTNKLQSSQKSETDLKHLIVNLLKLDLWGNRCDLSISAGREIKQTGNPFDLLTSLDECILVDRCAQIFNCIQSFQSKSTKIIDFILDNSGYELFSDFLLASAFIDNRLATKIRFHVKQIPWFISDVMPDDFHWTINTLANSDNLTLSMFGTKLLKYLNDGQIELCPNDYFWTSPYPFWHMKNVNKKLYDQLSEADLLIFKGDLNYRKLLGDFNWPFDADFKTVLKDFRPSNLCALRTVKADLICEVEKTITDKLTQEDHMWMETGKYGLIQFAALEN